MPLDQGEGIEPARQIAARLEHAGDLNADLVDVVLVHRRQPGAAALAFAFVAELELVEYGAVLRIEEYERRAAVGQRAQQRQPIAALRDILNYAWVEGVLAWTRCLALHVRATTPFLYRGVARCTPVALHAVARGYTWRCTISRTVGWRGLEPR